LIESLSFLAGTYTKKMGHVHGRGSGVSTLELNTRTGALTKVVQAAAHLHTKRSLCPQSNPLWADYPPRALGRE
jgi:hypothetical protein